MGNLQKLLKKSKIVFPKSLGESQVENLFEYLTKNFINVSYNKEIKGYMKNMGPMGTNKLEPVISKEKYCSNISGGMTDFSGENYASTNFNCSLEEVTETSNRRFDKLNFSTIPGYTLEEHNKKEVQLWDKVRDLIQKYFSET